jgi:hypothetical protein
MGKLATIGRIFFGTAIAGIGLQAVYYRDFPYIVTIPQHAPQTGIVMLAVIFGILFILDGASTLLKIKARPVSLLFGFVLLLIFCFYYIPYQFIVSTKYMHLGDWENAVKILTLAAGALVIAGLFPKKNGDSFTGFLEKLAPFGSILFAITIIDYGISHFLYAKEASDYVPSWIPYHLFWMYFCGAALLGSGIAILLKIRVGLSASLLGTMIFIWFISLHIPRVVVSPIADIGGELTSAFLALAYSGTAFVIAGANKKIS